MDGQKEGLEHRLREADRSPIVHGVVGLKGPQDLEQFRGPVEAEDFYSLLECGNHFHA